MGAAFRCRLREYDCTTVAEKLGHLIRASAHAGHATHFHDQTKAWERELRILGDMAAALMAWAVGSGEWWLLLEYEIPRRQKRPDAILLADGLVLVIEFKIEADCFAASNEWQVQSYALDLRDFHAASAGRIIIPILVATDAPAAALRLGIAQVAADASVVGVQRANAETLAACVRSAYESLTHRSVSSIDADAWEHSTYRATPTIIEAAESLFAGHQVSDISHSFATNLSQTADAIVAAVTRSQSQRCRTICFITGTPGAGKTLAGLSVVHSPALRRDGRPAAMFLSGNGPLVKIVREALTRDRHRSGTPRPQAARVVSALIANVHEFLVLHGIKRQSDPPPENAIIFDEAQRAWTADAVEKKHGVHRSEPALILDIMERAPDWCTVVALVGGGQEIHKGEAGLSEWGQALSSRQCFWRVMASPELVPAVGTSGNCLFNDPPGAHLEIVEAPELHLAVSVRSPRAKLIGQWVDDLLCNRLAESRNAEQLYPEFPITVTRSLEAARQWLRERAELHQRAGLLASSGAMRLRAHGIEVSSGFRKGYPYEDWFLSGPGDTRSSRQLEVVATEFECQGLELDWAGVCWGGDLIIEPGSGTWLCRRFRGTNWQRVNRPADRQYLLNKYRVLLTRARRGMVIWVPHGDPRDSTQDGSLLDATADYLVRAGIAAQHEE